VDLQGGGGDGGGGRRAAEKSSSRDERRRDARRRQRADKRERLPHPRDPTGVQRRHCRQYMQDMRQRLQMRERRRSAHAMAAQRGHRIADGHSGPRDESPWHRPEMRRVRHGLRGRLRSENTQAADTQAEDQKQGKAPEGDGTCEIQTQRRDDDGRESGSEVHRVAEQPRLLRRRVHASLGLPRK